MLAKAMGIAALTCSRLISEALFIQSVHRTARRFAPELGVPPHFLVLLLGLEDKRFAVHRGVDPLAVVRASISAILRLRPIQGGSTLTQQLYNIKHPTSGVNRNLKIKVRQILWALMHERQRSKSAILREYLDSVYFGRSYYGIGSAAAGYFGATIDSLTPCQSLFLVDRLSRPNSLSLVRLSGLLRRCWVKDLIPAERYYPELVSIYEQHFRAGRGLLRVLSTGLRQQSSGAGALTLAE